MFARLLAVAYFTRRTAAGSSLGKIQRKKRIEDATGARLF
jgi:hypothetical protein